MNTVGTPLSLEAKGFDTRNGPDLLHLIHAHLIIEGPSSCFVDPGDTFGLPCFATSFDPASRVHGCEGRHVQRIRLPHPVYIDVPHDALLNWYFYDAVGAERP